MRILLFVQSQQKGFLISLGRRIAESGHVLHFVPGDKDIANLIRKIVPSLARFMAIPDVYETKIMQSEAIRRGLEVEAKYDVRLSMLLSHYRALGRGYIFNADRYPTIRRSRWGHQRKLASLLQKILWAECLMDQYRPDLVLGLRKDPVISIVTAFLNCPYLSIATARLGDRYIWSDDLYFTSTDFLAALRESIAKPLEDLPSPGEYIKVASSKTRHGQINYTWGGTTKRIANTVINESKRILLKKRKKNSYSLFGWVPPTVRGARNFRLFMRCGFKPVDLAGRRAVFVPLHLEPEISLLYLSPEFNNSMEMIAWISKSAQADTLVIVKEHPLSFGIRSRRYYEQLIQIGNVVLANPETPSWEWIRATNVTATITGTAGVEAVTFGRPVLSFGRHQAINILPTVRLAKEYTSTKAGLDELFRLSQQALVFEHSRRALHAAQMHCSFGLPGFEKTHSSVELVDELADRAYAALVPYLKRTGKLASELG